MAEETEEVVKPVVADREGMPFCCGIAVLGNFNGGYKVIDTRKPLEEQARRVHGVLLATTVKWQREAIAELKAQGFQPLIQFWNDVHADDEDPKGNLVTLWVKDRGDGNMKRVGP